MTSRHHQSPETSLSWAPTPLPLSPPPVSLSLRLDHADLRRRVRSSDPGCPDYDVRVRTSVLGEEETLESARRSRVVD